jgi:hypothetical protein
MEDQCNRTIEVKEEVNRAQVVQLYLSMDLRVKPIG